MGIFDRFRKQQPAVKVEQKKIAVGAQPSNDTKSLQAFDNSNPTYSSSLASASYDDLLRDKQTNIVDLYKLADYYCDSDPIVHAIIKHVYVPFASSSSWFLTCDNEKTIPLFEQQYKKMRLRQKLEDIMLQFFKYGNVFIYIWNGNIMTLPPHKCKIGHTTLNGTPIVDYDVESISNEFRNKTYSTLETKEVKDDDLDYILKNAYPPQVAKAIKAGDQYAQLDPNNTFVVQGNKEGWQKYCVPWIACALYALAKKELISDYETSMLSLGARPFVHVTYGDPNAEMYPDAEQLAAIRRIFLSAMSGNPLAVTNHLSNSKIVQLDMKSLYEFPLYSQVNADILSAGGIAGIIVSGQSEDGSTFASAQISMQAAAARIELARREFEDLMNKVNARLVEDIKQLHTNNLKTIPQFHFTPLDMSGTKALREACENLWNNGVVSTKTYLQMNGYDLTQEKAQREKEKQDGTDQTFISREATNAAIAEPTETETTDSESQSDPDASRRGAQPKPSSPEGSMPDDEGIT